MAHIQLIYFSLFFLLPTAFADNIKHNLQLDPNVQQLAEDLMKKQYSYEDAFNIAIEEAYQCIYGNIHRNSRICLSYGFSK